MNLINHKKGFTLIELLVVISMIGLLSSIVLASLGTARVKASDAAIKSDLRGIISSAEIEYASLGYSYNTTGTAVNQSDTSTYINNGNGIGTILANQKIKDAIVHIASINGGQPITTNISSDGKTYTISVPLKTPLNIAVLDSRTGNVNISGSLVAPTISVANTVSPSSVLVSWIDSSNYTFASSYGRTISYALEQSTNNGASWSNISNGSGITNSSNDKINFNFINSVAVGKSKTYSYRVKAQMYGVSDSSYSNTASIFVP